MTPDRGPSKGHGPITPDGCSVEVYRNLPTNGEPELIDQVLLPGSRVLELGCGTGRLANALAARGHRVWGVDESLAMLDHLRGVTAFCGRIEQVRLNATFDAVLLASNLISTAGHDRRHRYLDTCTRHLAPDGLLIVQWLPPSWFTDITAISEWEELLGPVHGRLNLVHIADDYVTAETSYRIGDRVWTQRINAYPLTEAQLIAELRLAGLRIGRWIDDDHNWFLAQHAD